MSYQQILNQLPKLSIYHDKELALKLSYRHQEFDNKIPILFLHGFNGNSKSWAYQFIHFKNKRSVIAIDAPGFGKSDPIDEDMSMIATLVNNLLINLGINKFDLVGHSMGGMLAQIISSRYSNSVNKLVLSCTHKGYAMPPGSPLRDPYRRRLEERKNLSDQEFGKLRINKMLPELDNGEIFNFLSSISEEITEDSIKSGGMAMQRLDTSNFLSKVKQPCLILKGSKDVVVSSERSNNLERSLPHAEVEELSNVGHAPYCEDSKAFNKVLETFLNT